MKLIKDETWVDRYGKSVLVSAMSEDYAKNVLRKILREARQRPAVEQMFNQFINDQFDVKQRYPV